MYKTFICNFVVKLHADGMYTISSDDGNGAVLSLEFANNDEDCVYEVEADRRINNRIPLLEYRSRIREYSNTNTTIYCLYEAQLHRRNSWDIESILSELSRKHELLTLPAIDAFESVQEEWNNDGKDVNWYKEPEIEKVIRAIDRVEFGQPVATVGGELLSRLITEHPFLNANHRTSISYLEMYLSTYNPEFSMPTTGITGEWFDWAQEYVYSSKKIMTLARKCGLLRWLRDYGYECVTRDGDNQIIFDEYDLDRRDYLDHYSNGLHLEESIAFVHGHLDRTNSPELFRTNDNGLEWFIRELTD